MVLAPTVSAEDGLPEIVTEDIVQTLEALVPVGAEIEAETDTDGEAPEVKEPTKGEDDARGVLVFSVVDKPPLEDGRAPAAEEAAKLDDETEGIPLVPEDEWLGLEDGGDPFLDDPNGLVLTLVLPGEFVESKDW